MTSSTKPPHKTPEGFNIREATSSDVNALADLFFTSFTPSHPFWPVMIPHNETGVKWWREAWRMGIEEDPTTRAFIVEDTSANNNPVAFSRWVVPQQDGNQHRLFPELSSEWDKDICGAFFGGIAENRATIMGKKPHWMLELLGVDQDYQQRGLGFALVEWGCRQADEQKLETYLDASMKGRPFYKKNFGFDLGKLVHVPERPASYGRYEYASVVRPAQSQ